MREVNACSTFSDILADVSLSVVTVSVYENAKGKKIRRQTRRAHHPVWYRPSHRSMLLAFSEPVDPSCCPTQQRQTGCFPANALILVGLLKWISLLGQD